MRLTCSVLLSALALLACLGPAAAGDLQFDARADTIRVANDYYALTVDLARGGAVRSFRYLEQDEGADREWIYPGGGFFQDMIWQQGHPGELQDHPYQHRILENTPQVLRLELWRAFERAPYPGLVMRKTLTFRADSPALHVTMTLENPTAEPMFPGAWVQNRFYCGGEKGVQMAYRPSNLGIRAVYVEDGGRVGDEFVRKPSAGWAMTFDRDNGYGLLMLVDYNYLRMHYSCITVYTTEVFYDRVLLQPGRSWTTQYSLLPVKGIRNCYYGDEEVFLTAEYRDSTLRWLVRATEYPVAELPLTVRIVSSDRRQVLGEQTVTLRDLVRHEPQSVEFDLPDLGRSPVIVSFELGPGGERSTEFMYSADETMYWLQESAVPYRAELPRKIKPELMGDRDLRLTLGENLSVWFAVGLWSEFNRFRDMLRDLDRRAEIFESFYTAGVLGPELTHMPLLAEELMGHDLVVLDNVGANALGAEGDIAVTQYVQAGGSLLVSGGLCTLGKGRFQEADLRAALPFEVGGFFDVERLPDFTPLECPGARYAHLGAVEWIQKPARLKPDAEVLMTAGGHPLLVRGKYGRGQVLVWLGLPAGDPPPGVLPYWRSRGWYRQMRDYVSELLPAR